MNDKIKDIENKIEQNKETLVKLKENLIFEHEEFLKEKGITNGTKVKVKTWKDHFTEGIFSHVYIEYSRGRPKIMRIKKDGTAHATATIWCNDFKDIIYEH